MARLFKMMKYRKDPESGKHQPVLDRHGQFTFYEIWRGEYTDHKGKRRVVRLAKSKPESKKQLDLIEARERETKLGLRPASSSATLAYKRNISEIFDEYLHYGSTKGGRRNKPWSLHNLKKRKYYLGFWKEHLKLVRLGDIVDCCDKAEKVLEEHRVFGDRTPAGRTLHAYREALVAFCTWCKGRKYLNENPFESMAKYDPTPKDLRRAMSREEMQLLFKSVPLHRRIVYETAILTGYRKDELRSLTLAHINAVRGGIHLNADDDKNYTARLQAVTDDFIARLTEYGKSGDALKRYQASFAKARKPMRDDIPKNPLLFLPVQTAVMIKADLKKAGIPQKTMDGYLDFHALRVAYINLVIESGADIKTIQESARHERVETSLKYYARAKRENLILAAKAVEKAVFWDKNDADCTKSTLIPRNEISTKNAIPLIQKDCVDGKMVGRDGFEPS